MSTSADCKVEVSAPGKIIFHGEHAVVYGKPAVAASLSLRTHLTLKATADSMVSLQFPDIGVDKKYSTKLLQDALQDLPTAGTTSEPVPASDEVIAALKTFAAGDSLGAESKEALGVVAFLYLYYSITKTKSGLPSLSVQVVSELPVGAGLGSSGAFSASLAAAFLQFSGAINAEKVDQSFAEWSASQKELINKWAFVGDKVIHGQPSGVDNTISTFGGAIKFMKNEKNPITPINKMPTLPIMLVNTTVPRSTKALVAKFRQKYDTYRDVCDPILQAMESIANRSLDVFTELCDKPSEGCYTSLADLVDMNQQLLDLMGMGHPALDQIVSVAAKNGLHAKLTGAGGGGCAFVLIPPSTEASCLEKLRSELESLGQQVWMNATVGGHGVRRHL
ncbi:mevalonate kinase [Aplysia californica]|uniref:Mevalonate kinase n=1 Tax=Aplysia californica TaxID=6500 RepID=A0ABM0K991_APLCA|nr:mevalonate kinase [Aplysia californica]